MAYLIKRHLKTGDRYYVRYYVAGRRYWIAAGTTKRGAEKVRDNLVAKLAAGESPRRSTWTLRDLSKVYLDRMATARPRSDAWRRARFDQLLARLGDTLLEDLDVGTLDRYCHARVHDERRAVATVNGEVAVLRHAVRMAVRWRGETQLQQFKLGDWRQVRGKARQPVFLTHAEVERILEWSRRRGGPGDLFLRLFLATGARPQEILQASFRGNRIDLKGLKGGRDRTVELEQALVDEVHALGMPTWHQARRHWRLVRADAGVRCRLYDIRHTVASEFLRRGATMREAQLLLGHQTARMTEKYAHFAKNAPALPALLWYPSGTPKGARKGKSRA